MTETIFICDEMLINVARIISILEATGFKVAYYANATEGLQYLRGQMASQLVPRLMIVDMALEPGPDEHDFPDDTIDEGQITGIVLIQKIFSYARGVDGLDKTKLAKRTLLYTRVNEEMYVMRARQFAKDHGIYFSKKRIEDDGEFIELLRRLLNPDDAVKE